MSCWPKRRTVPRHVTQVVGVQVRKPIALDVRPARTSLVGWGAMQAFPVPAVSFIISGLANGHKEDRTPLLLFPADVISTRTFQRLEFSTLLGRKNTANFAKLVPAGKCSTLHISVCAY